MNDTIQADAHMLLASARWGKRGLPGTYRPGRGSGMQAAILRHIQGALREGCRCVVAPPRRRRFGTVTGFTETAMCFSR